MTEYTCINNIKKMHGVTFGPLEINSIHHVENVYLYILTEKYWDKGVIFIQINNFDDT